MVVLDEDPAPVRCDLGHPLGHHARYVAVGVPGLHPPAVGAGPAGRVEQVVVAEPQGGVGHHVVGEVVERRASGSTSSMREPVVGHQPCRRRPRSASPNGAGHPGGAGARDQRGRASRRARPRGGAPAAVLHRKASGPTVGDDHGVRRTRRRGPRSGPRAGRFGAHGQDATPCVAAGRRHAPKAGLTGKGVDKVVSDHSQWNMMVSTR